MQATFLKTKKYTAIFEKPYFFILLVLAAGIVVSAQNLILESQRIPEEYGLSHYNNFLIFKQSFLHLWHNENLYQEYPSEYFDYYKYSPSFALAMAPFYYLSDVWGLIFWNLLNTSVLGIAIWQFPFKNIQHRVYALLFIFIELITSLQNSQCNALIAGLILLAFIHLEKRKGLLAALLIMLTFFIKLFGLAGIILLLFYPQKGKNIEYSLTAFVVLLLLPLVLISPQMLWQQYQNWWQLLQLDHQTSYGLSISACIYYGLHIAINKPLLLLSGTALLLLPLVRYKSYKTLPFRALFLAALMIWMVIFNHKAESPSYIIALAGVSIWYFFSEKTPLDKLLLVIVFVFSVLSPTDIFPRHIRIDFFEHYAIKAIPCILVWIRIVFSLLYHKYPAATSTPPLSTNHSAY